MSLEDAMEAKTIQVRVLQGGGTLAKPACDVCGSPGSGVMISAAAMRHAAIDEGFNPYALGLIGHTLVEMIADIAYQDWRQMVAAGTRLPLIAKNTERNG